MPIAVDASSPTVVNGGGSTSTITTASFTPPANSLLVAMATNGGSNVPTISGSSGGAWTRLGSQHVNSRSVQIWVCDIGASAAQTVTLAGVLSVGSTLQVVVVTGASIAASQTGATASSAAASEISLTPTALGSLLLIATTPVGLTAVSNTTLHSAGTSLGTFGYATTLTTALTPVTYGFSGGSSNFDTVGVEILGPNTTPISKTVSAAWNVQASVTSVRQGLWDVRSIATKTRQALWNDLTTVATISRQALWNDTGKVQVSRTAVWRVRAHPQAADILQAAAVEIDFGMEVLDSNDLLVEDITVDLVGGEVDLQQLTGGAGNTTSTFRGSISASLRMGSLMFVVANSPGSSKRSTTTPSNGLRITCSCSNASERCTSSSANF